MFSPMLFFGNNLSKEHSHGPTSATEMDSDDATSQKGAPADNPGLAIDEATQQA